MHEGDVEREDSRDKVMELIKNKTVVSYSRSLIGSGRGCVLIAVFTVAITVTLVLLFTMLAHLLDCASGC